SLLGQVVLSTSGFDASFSRPQDVYTFVDLRPGADPAAIERALGSFPEATVRTADEFIEKRMADFTTTLNMLYALLGLSVIVSLFGMVNTLVLSVFERTRELGMLRAVGMTRRQARRMIRHESVITALIGAALGLPLGIGFAALVTEAMRQYEIGLTLPVGTLVVFTLVTIVAGIAAAIFPARRASRLDVLHALQYE
ncbi:MAG: ABC transporter permease, partial [Gaiellaceae bacterium]